MCCLPMLCFLAKAQSPNQGTPVLGAAQSKAVIGAPKPSDQPSLKAQAPASPAIKGAKEKQRPSVPKLESHAQKAVHKPEREE